jgi:uncharacterized protein (TIGR02679 family)
MTDTGPTGIDRQPWRHYAAPSRNRIMAAARRSLETSGGDLSRSLSIAAATDDERALIIAMTGTHRQPGSARLRISLAQLDTAIRADTGLGLIDVLERLGPPLRNRPAERAAEGDSREAALDHARASHLHRDCPWYRRWLTDIEADGTLTSLIRSGRQHLLADARRVLEILISRAPGAHPLPLPSLSAQATADTKSLNKGGLSTLVLRALAEASGAERPVTPHDRRRLWDSFDVIVDDLSSQVLVLNLRPAGAGLAEWLTSAASTGTPFVVTLHQLVTHPTTFGPGVVHVCENPAVLRRAATELAHRCPPLICTQGWPSTAFHRLARAVASGGGSLRYHGDFDRPGIEMTAKLLERYPCRPWRMTAQDYLTGLVAEGNPVKLNGDPIATPWDPALAEAMGDHQYAVYEETLADVLIADLAESSHSPAQSSPAP